MSQYLYITENGKLKMENSYEMCIRDRVIAGPCSAETEEQVMSTAKQLADKGDVYKRQGEDSVFQVIFFQVSHIHK